MANYLKTPILLVLVFLTNATIVFSQNIFQQRSGLTDIEFIGFSSVYPSDTVFLLLEGGKPIITPNIIPPLHIFLYGITGTNKLLCSEKLVVGR